MPRSLIIIVPCFNEEEILSSTSTILSHFLMRAIKENWITADSKICFVDDGSKDGTWLKIEEIIKHTPNCTGIKLSRNFGHQAAILAGLLENINLFELYITIDADLQDDVEAMKEMLHKNKEGANIVYGVRNDRSSDSFFKRSTAETFYRLMQKMGVPIIFNHTDFRLMDNKVLQNFSRYKEVNLFIRGIIPSIGFKTEKVYYQRLPRKAGKSKYPFSKMTELAWNGVTSFSTKPMKMVLWFGIINFLVALLLTFYVLYGLFYGKVVKGWTSTVLPMLYFSGANMIAIGMIGEYIGKIYEEIKGRPRYIVEEVLKNE